MDETMEDQSEVNKDAIVEENNSEIMEVDRVDPSDESVPASQQTQSQTLVKEGQDQSESVRVLETFEGGTDSTPASGIDAEVASTPLAASEVISKGDGDATTTLAEVEVRSGQEEGGQGSQEEVAASIPVSEVSIKIEKESQDVVQEEAGADGGKAVVVIKSETGEEQKETGTSPTSSSQVKIETDLKIKAENMKSEAADVDVKGEEDAYMVLDEADESDNENGSSDETDEEDLPEVERLRRTNRQLNERLSLLEEFIEVEFAEKFDGFVKKRERLMDVMGLDSTQEMDQSGGKRPKKSKELVGILKLVKDQASSSTSMSNGNRKPSSGSGSGSRTSGEDRKRRSGVNSSSKSSPSKTGRSSKNEKSETSSPLKSSNSTRRCYRCNSADHMVQNCPQPSTRAATRISEKERKRQVKLKIEKEPNPEIRNLRNRRRRIGRVIERMRKKDRSSRN